jgi:hypothetical protein
MRANLAVSVLVLSLGPVSIGVGTQMINADAELERSGERATGTITAFHDEWQASDRKMKVEFPSRNGSLHYKWVSVDYHQHPLVGGEVTMAYRDDDPGQATALGYESDGVWWRGVGTVLTCLFGGIGVLAFFFWRGLRKDRKRERIHHG